MFLVQRKDERKSYPQCILLSDFSSYANSSQSKSSLYYKKFMKILILFRDRKQKTKNTQQSVSRTLQKEWEKAGILISFK